jgi:hypothetical protein
MQRKRETPTESILGRVLKTEQDSQDSPPITIVVDDSDLDKTVICDNSSSEVGNSDLEVEEPKTKKLKTQTNAGFPKKTTNVQDMDISMDSDSEDNSPKTLAQVKAGLPKMTTNIRDNDVSTDSDSEDDARKVPYNAKRGFIKRRYRPGKLNSELSCSLNLNYVYFQVSAH